MLRVRYCIKDTKKGSEFYNEIKDKTKIFSSLSEAMKFCRNIKSKDGVEIIGKPLLENF